MNTEPENPIWQRLSKALFGGRKTTDEGLFTFRVMQQIRGLSQDVQDLAWPRFLHWAVPLLGVGMATLILAAHAPRVPATLLMENALFHKQTLNDDPLSVVLEDLR